MKKLKSSHSVCTRKSQAGITLLETTIAVTILLIVTVNVLAMAVVAISTTENQGHLAARTAEYAQDKMEQLMALAYNDSTTDTTVFPAVTNPPGTGLAPGGSSDPSGPVAGYVDYLDASGNPLAGGAQAPTNWYYIRVWKISTPAGTSNLKQITVSTQVRSGVGAGGASPQSTVASLKSNPF